MAGAATTVPPSAIHQPHRDSFPEDDQELEAFWPPAKHGCSTENTKWPPGASRRATLAMVPSRSSMSDRPKLHTTASNNSPTSSKGDATSPWM